MCGWTSISGSTCLSSGVATVVSGQPAYYSGKVMESQGEALTFAR